MFIIARYNKIMKEKVTFIFKYHSGSIAAFVVVLVVNVVAGGDLTASLVWALICGTLLFLVECLLGITTAKTKRQKRFNDDVKKRMNAQYEIYLKYKQGEHLTDHEKTILTEHFHDEFLI